MFIALALAACALPWLTNPSASLSLSVYDLAEWTSLVPAVRSGGLLPTLLLRLPLAWLAGLVTLSPGNRAVKVIFVVAAAAALLPPLHFFYVLDDVNYRQQFALAVLTLIVGLMMGFSNRVQRWRAPLAAMIGVAGAVTAIMGLIQAHALMRSYQLSPQAGLGGVLFITCFFALVYMSAQKQTR